MHIIPWRDVSLLETTLPIKSNQKRMHVIDLGQIDYINKDQSYPLKLFYCLE